VDPAEAKPPRPFWHAIRRFALGGFLITLLSAGAVATTLLLQVKELTTVFKTEAAAIPGIESALDDVDPGGPQTLLLIGSDQRYIDKKQGNPVRSDTMMLARLDPDKGATALLSVPRDLKVEIPGHGTDKINAAYSLGGARLAVQTVRSIFDINVNHVVTVAFGGFRRAVDRLGCVYADIDRRYYNDNTGAGPDYAEIDIKPGYQKLCGQKALDYVRHRHSDDDFGRAARQQEFLSAAKDQIGLSRVFSDRTELVRIFGRYTQTDIADDNQSAILRLLKLAFEASQVPVQEVKFRAGLSEDGVYVETTPDQIAKMRREFLSAKGTPGEGQTKRSVAGRRTKRSTRRSRGLPPGVVNATRQGEDAVVEASMKLDFPVYFPKAKMAVGSYQDTRTYDIVDRAGRRHRAYRMVVNLTNDIGQNYGIQGMTWTNPPILDSPTFTRKLRGRTYMYFRDGSRYRMIAWRTKNGVYWVSNTLARKLTNSQMEAIARSLGRIGEG
jgi:polyisoprenyl-teichoic acid--peptidoglycan teichoic acid transferase